MKLKNTYVIKKIMDECVLIPITAQGGSDAFAINDMGYFILQQLQNEATVEEIIQKISQEYEDIPVNFQDEVKGFIRELKEQGLLTD